MSLRTRLLAGLVVLVTAGLAVTAVVTYEEQRSFLSSRVSQQLQSALGPMAVRLGLGHGLHPLRPRSALPGRGRAGPRIAPLLAPGTFGELRSSSGAVLRRRSFGYRRRALPIPTLPSHPPLSEPGSLRTFTVRAAGGSGAEYRAAALRSGTETLIVGVSLREVQQTLHRLVMVELLVSAGVILALIGLGWLVIRIGLRPLTRIGRTASEIAAGDLSRRVDPAGARTEVGRLGSSLNEMLGQIELAFAERRRSEARLRRFLADSSHELRTPLATIRGYAELFRIGAATEPETLTRAMSRIESEATRMGMLVEDLLLLASLDQEPQPRRVAVELAQLVAHAADDLRAIAPDRAVTVAGIEHDTEVVGDPDQLRQLLANLTRNAAIHTPPGTAIELELRRRPEFAEIEVRDHGPGLPTGDPALLFERFWRSEVGRARGRGGSGLGLAIVQAVVAAHGGTVAAGDAPGGGARFMVVLPLAPAERISQENLSLLTSDS